MFMFTGWVFVCVLVWFGGAWIYSSLSLVWETAHMVMVTVQGAPQGATHRHATPVIWMVI